MKKTALVTGASAGIGKATVRRLLKDGYTVYAAARRKEKMQDLKELGAAVLAMDVTSEASMKKGVAQIIGEQGKIDVLVNDAGFGSHGAVEDVPMDEARMQFEVNVFGLACLTRLVLPHMRRRRYGKIVNISSVAGKIYTPMGAWYYASKHAVEGFSDCLRLEAAPFHIDVIIIEPGLIKSEWLDIAMGNLEKCSAGGAYKEMAHKTVNSLKNYERKGSKPEVIGDVISRALKTKRPKTRYAAGRMAKAALFFRKWLPDRIYDFFIVKIR